MQLSFTLVTGERLEFHSHESSIIIGRSQRCHVVIPHEGMSREHCRIDIEKGKIFITDLDSLNGVYIEGEAIESGVKTPYLLSFSLSFGAVKSARLDTSSKPLPGSIPTATPLGESEKTSTRTKTIKMEHVNQDFELELESIPKPKKKKQIILTEEDTESTRSHMVTLGVAIAVVVAIFVMFYK